jgi:hypothetical protein
MLGFVDKLSKPLTLISNAPDEVRVVSGRKGGAVPVRLETLNDLSYLVFICSHDSVVAGHRRFLVCQLSDLT